jgi:hypothetical protein
MTSLNEARDGEERVGMPWGAAFASVPCTVGVGSCDSAGIDAKDTETKSSEEQANRKALIKTFGRKAMPTEK